MKVEFSTSSVYVPDFLNNRSLPEDQQLKAELKVTDLIDLIDLSDLLSAKSSEQVLDSKKLDPKRSKAIVSAAGQYLPKYVTLINADGFNIENVIRHPKFMALAVELVFELVRISSPSGEDVKN